jgi:hypothetical protein
MVARFYTIVDTAVALELTLKPSQQLTPVDPSMSNSGGTPAGTIKRVTVTV